MGVFLNMKLKKAIEIENKHHKQRMEVRIKKGKDYASEEDCLTNFKVRALILGLLNVDTSKSYSTAINDIILKLQRTCNLLFPKPRLASNESLWDTVAIDFPNYVDLLKEILLDEGIISEPEDDIDK